MSTRLRNAVAAMSVAFALLFSSETYATQQAEIPRDDTLIAIFQAHRGELEKLRHLMIEKPPGVPLLDETNVSARLGTELRNEYKSLLKMWPGLLVGGDYDGSVRFIFAGQGQAIGPDWAKGIEFIPDTGKVIGTPKRDTLDDAAKLPADLYFRELEPHWFLFFQRDE